MKKSRTSEKKSIEDEDNKDDDEISRLKQASRVELELLDQGRAGNRAVVSEIWQTVAPYVPVSILEQLTARYKAHVQCKLADVLWGKIFAYLDVLSVFAKVERMCRQWRSVSLSGPYTHLCPVRPLDLAHCWMLRDRLKSITHFTEGSETPCHASDVMSWIFAKCTRLQSIQLGTREPETFSDDKLVDILRQCSKHCCSSLTELNIPWRKGFSLVPDCVTDLLSAIGTLPRLQTLVFPIEAYDGSISLDQYARIQHLSHLASLTIHDLPESGHELVACVLDKVTQLTITNASTDDFNLMEKVFPNLENLQFNCVDDESEVKGLQALPCLKKIRLSSKMPICVEALQRLLHSPQLQEIDLPDVRLCTEFKDGEDDCECDGEIKSRSTPLRSFRVSICAWSPDLADRLTRKGISVLANGLPGLTTLALFQRSPMGGLTDIKYSRRVLNDMDQFTSLQHLSLGADILSRESPTKKSSNDPFEGAIRLPQRFDKCLKKCPKLQSLSLIGADIPETGSLLKLSRLPCFTHFQATQCNVPIYHTTPLAWNAYFKARQRQAPVISYEFHQCVFPNYGGTKGKIVLDWYEPTTRALGFRALVFDEFAICRKRID